MTKTMYDAVNGTEYTTIVANVTTVATTINLTDVDVLPSATNILHLYKVDSDGIITDWERCKFTAIVDPSVTISRSGDEHSSSDNGNAIAFSSGDRVARFISGWDLNALNENVAENTIEIAENTIEIATKIGTSDTKTLTNKTIDADSNTISNIGSSEVSSNLITGQDALGETVDDADYLLLYDTSGNSLKKVLISNLPSGGDVATDAIWDAKGDMAMGTGADTAQKLTVGANGTVLTADSTETTGTKWAEPSGGDVATDTIWDAKGDMAVGTGADTAQKLTVGANGTVPVADSGETTGLKYVAAKRTLWLSGAGGMPATTLPDAGFSQIELGTNDIDVKGTVFETSADALSYHVWNVRMPENYDGSVAMSVMFCWMCNTAAATGDIRWQIQAQCSANGDALDTAYCTRVGVTDSITTVDNYESSSESGAIAPSGTDAGGNYMTFRVGRDFENGDTSAAAVILLGVRVYYTTDNYSDV